ncbi:MAG: HU family DNA-binding protein [Prevotella sp.]|nr:HU family DNA-binding protein [Alistipes senegalensis]MCM1357191.1 HU family DNA-binding protein [Prevotella sp.]MCM1474245.1 HU family DNA-binding protein [Muribaculaceae bacterium]MDE6425060.1 HU family DNA-binding protein [Ruminococcus sp.]
MTKSELIVSLAASMNCTKKDASAAVDATFAVIQETLEKGEKVSVTGFGTFEIRERGEKICTNPKTKEKMVCPPCKTPVFHAGRDLKRTINK